MPHDTASLDLFLEHRRALVEYAAPIVGCRAQAEDVVQEAYLRFSTASARERAPEDRIVHSVSYLYRIVRNLALDWARRAVVEGAPSRDAALESLASPAPSPESQALYRDEVRVLTVALSELPVRTRSAFEMYRLDGLTLHQVAARLGISVGLAHHLVRDAMTHCAERLGYFER